jgi:hypothetical protein
MTRQISLPLLVVPALLLACSSTEPAFPLDGTYDLLSLDGRELPQNHSWTDRAGHLNQRDLTGGDFTFRNGHWVEVRRFRTAIEDGSELRRSGRMVVESAGDEHRLLMGPFGSDTHRCTVRRSGMECEEGGVLSTYRNRP